MGRSNWKTKLEEWKTKFDQPGFKQVRRVVIFVVGMAVLILGIALLVLPGPAIIVIPAGLAILGLEFGWARRWMRRAKEMIKSSRDLVFRRGGASKQKSHVSGDGGDDAAEKGRESPTGGWRDENAAVPGS